MDKTITVTNAWTKDGKEFVFGDDGNLYELQGDALMHSKILVGSLTDEYVPMPQNLWFKFKNMVVFQSHSYPNFDRLFPSGRMHVNAIVRVRPAPAPRTRTPVTVQPV